MKKLQVKSKTPKKELDIFFWASVACFAVAVSVFPWLATASLLLSARAMMLTFHDGVKGEYYIPRLRAVAAIVIAGSIWSLV